MFYLVVDTGDHASPTILRLYTSADARPRVKAANQRQTRDNSSLLGGEVGFAAATCSGSASRRCGFFPLVHLHLEDWDLGDDFVDEGHLEADEFVDARVPASAGAVQRAQELDSLLDDGAGVWRREGHAGAPTLLYLQYSWDVKWTVESLEGIGRILSVLI